MGILGLPDLDKLNLNNIEQSLSIIAQQLSALEDGLANGTLSLQLSYPTSTAFTATQVSVTTGATLLKALNASRKALALRNTGAVTVYLGASDVTASTGWPVLAGEMFQMSTNVSTAAIYGITGSSTATVGVLEW